MPPKKNLHILKKKNWKIVAFLRVTDRYKLTQALVVDPLYLQHSYSESAIDYRASHTITIFTL